MAHEYLAANFFCKDISLEKPLLGNLIFLCQEKRESSGEVNDLGFEAFAATLAGASPRQPTPVVLLLVYVEDVTGTLRVCLIFNLFNQRSRVFLLPTTKNMNKTNPCKVAVKAKKYAATTLYAKRPKIHGKPNRKTSKQLTEAQRKASLESPCLCIPLDANTERTIKTNSVQFIKSIIAIGA